MSLSSERIVALKLHGIHEEDREWILSQLDPSIQSRLMPLLGELKELGLEIEPAMIESIESGDVNQERVLPEKSVSFSPDIVAAINAAPLSQLELLFDQEPPILLETLYALHPWRWRPEISNETSRIGQSISYRIDVSRKESLPTDAVKQALLKAVVRHLDAGKYFGSQLMNEKAAQSFSTKTKPTLRHFIDKILPWKQ